MVRAPACHVGSCGFKSRQSRIISIVPWRTKLLLRWLAAFSSSLLRRSPTFDSTSASYHKTGYTPLQGERSLRRYPHCLTIYYRLIAIYPAWVAFETPPDQLIKHSPLPMTSNRGFEVIDSSAMGVLQALRYLVSW